MHRILVIAVIAGSIGVIVAIVLGMLVSSYHQIQFSVTDVSLTGINFAPITASTLLNGGLAAASGDIGKALISLIEGINVNVIFAISNHGVLPIYLPNFSYDLLINGIKIGHGNGTANFWINPGENKTVPVNQDLKRTDLETATASIIQTQGVMQVSVNGTAYTQLLGMSIPIPFTFSKEISLKDEAVKFMQSR